MVKVRFYKIQAQQLTSLPIQEGQIIFLQDTGELYIDKDNSNRVKIKGDNDLNLVNGDQYGALQQKFCLTGEIQLQGDANVTTYTILNEEILETLTIGTIIEVADFSSWPEVTILTTTEITAIDINNKTITVAETLSSEIAFPDPSNNIASRYIIYKISQANGISSIALGVDTVAEGEGAYTEGIETHTYAWGAHAEGNATTALAPCSHAEGDSTETNGSASHAEGTFSKANGSSSHVEGENTIADGNRAHAEGESTYAIGDYTHTEGNGTRAVGSGAHAEGTGGVAYAENSHVEGVHSEKGITISGAANTRTYTTLAKFIPLLSIGTLIRLGVEWSTITAINTNNLSFTVDTSLSSTAVTNAQALIKYGGAFNTASHAEGNGTIAKGKYSHTEGNGTIATGDNQHVQGKYNIVDTNKKYAHIIGNGTNNTLSNAHTIDWQGNTWYSGQAKIGGTSYDDPDAKTLATQDYVNDAKTTITIREW